MALEAYASKERTTVVTPVEIKPRVDVYCTQCGGRMRIRRSYTREDGVVVIRHFTHIPEDVQRGVTTSCSGGGEGDPHLRAKGIAVETLNQFYQDGEAMSEREFSLPAVFEKDTRSGDAVVAFDDPHPEFGAGIVIEVQDKHKDKDVLATTQAYLANGYSVCWLSVDAFGKYSLKYGKSEFEALLRDDFPDGESVFDADLNPDGTVPRNEMYPLVAAVWPHAVEIARETRPRVESGWPYPAYDSDGNGQMTLQAERAIDRREMNPMPPRTVELPIEWHEARARQLFRETPWNALFDSYVWDTDEIRQEWSNLAAIDEMDVKIPLPKWLADDDLAMVVGERVEKSPNKIHHDYDISLSYSKKTVDIGASENKVAVFVPDSEIHDLNLNSETTALITQWSNREAISELEFYVPASTAWNDIRWSARFSGTLELPIKVDIDGEETTPTGDVPMGTWIATERPPRILNLLQRAHEQGFQNRPKSEKDKLKAKEFIPDVIRHNTGGPQPNTIEDDTILIITSSANISSDAVRWALQRLVSDGTLEKSEPNRYRLPDSGDDST